MRQILRFEEVLRGCGREILEGLRRFWSVMCFLVVSVSQMGLELSRELSSSSSSAPARRLFLPLKAVVSWGVELMCDRRALEAFNT
jgi:hypothetical protein